MFLEQPTRRRPLTTFFLKRFFINMNRNIFLPAIYVSLTALLFFLLQSTACRNRTGAGNHGSASSDSAVVQGKALANIYCQGCHLVPAPELLTKGVWLQGVLPNMGPRMGIFSYAGMDYPSYKNDPFLGRNFYPSTPAMTASEWDAIVRYYVGMAPDTLIAPQRAQLVDDGDRFFKILQPAIGSSPPVTCMVKIVGAGKEKQIVTSDVLRKKIFIYNDALQLTDSIETGGPVTDLAGSGDRQVACNIGVINPTNGRFGKLQPLPSNKAVGKKAAGVPLADSLYRPVQIVAADLNKDGKTDYLVCEFGNLIGALSWLENKGGERYIRHIIKNVPGAITAFVNDYNGDGLPDLWVLFAQADECISLFTNKGHGVFEEKQVLRFPSVYGSSSFDLVDVNKDGLLDIVYTAGDNADFSKILKPYHGVYIFLNQGNNVFKQSWFYPVNGAFKVLARDFDGDGDIDMAVISFFSDYKRLPQEGFIYFENTGKEVFKPHSVKGTELGRWLTMDAGDIDGDGKIDLILGNFSIAPSFMPSSVNWKKSPPFMVLKNIMPTK